MINKRKFCTLFYLLNIVVSFAIGSDREELNKYNEVIKYNIKTWADDISNKLLELNKLTRKDDVKESFKNTNVIEEEWDIIVENVAQNIREMMEEKVSAVKAIKTHAEILSEHRKSPLNTFSGYDYYDTNTLNDVEDVEDRTKDRLESEQIWKCSIPSNQEGLCHEYLDDEGYQSDYVKDEYDSFNNKAQPKSKLYERSVRPNCKEMAYLKRPPDYYRAMNMAYNPHFDAEVNVNYSIIRVTPGVHERAPAVLNGIRWSEALDLTFKCNFKNDPTLTYQYFGSPKGFFRFYPAMKWSEEEYDQTFDFRIRSWYIEGIASAKDIIILLDRSGSMKGYRRLVATEIVNSILDTLTDNDYVNIYTFANTTSSLVDCFNDTLVQANEENLRLLREQLEIIDDKFYSDISLGFEKAFPILWKYRKARHGEVICNQAIMLITEGLDYEYKDTLFKTYNFIPDEDKYYRPIRVFTYLLGTEPNDAQRMKWIACANMGYYVNITVVADVREKVLKYLEVMSRPLNLNPHVEPEPAWTALYVHLNDRRLSNWLWRKNEGNRQRDIFIAYGKERNVEHGRVIKENQTYYTENTEHDFEKYLEVREYKYLTSVSLPVFDRRVNHTNLLGVAGVDVPLDYIKQLTEPHRIGVNGYAFIITNNGYVLHHPDHRKEFKDRILKPTFNRVDFTEVEMSNDTIIPRNFDEAIIKLRNNIVLESKGRMKLKVRAPIDDMRRVILGSRHYYHTKVGPFSLVIALPDRYGFLVIRHSKTEKTLNNKDICKHLKNNSNWRIHPKWLYTCKTLKSSRSIEKDLLNHWCTYADMRKTCNVDLIEAVKKDISITEWFRNPLSKSFSRAGIVLVFMATHAGLTRWQNLLDVEEDENHFANRFNYGPDEVYYRRSAEFNYDKPDTFMYSVPFSMDEEYNENTTLVTASNVIFQVKGNKKAPVAAVGYQILHRYLNSYIERLKFKQRKDRPYLKNFNATREDEIWQIYVLDNDGVIIFHNDTEAIGKSLADVNKILIDYLVKDGVYKEITVFDYQGTCYPKYANKKTKKKKTEYYGPTYEEAMNFDTCDKKKSPIKCKTIEFLRRQLQKTIPTPCDIELKMFNSLWENFAYLIPPKNQLDCNCNYLSQHIKGTNLMLIVVKENCCHFDEDKKHIPVTNDYPKEITYNLTLPCYIETMNRFSKKHYTNCVIKNQKEFVINVDNENCGGEGIIPIE